MLRLNLLGAVDLVDDAATSIAVGGPSLALLTYLAVEGREKPLRRETVANLVWPEATNPRGSLSTAISALRKQLGEDVIWTRGHDDVRLNPDQIECDCTAFIEFAKAGELEQAAELYRGEFAAGFNPRNNNEFESWLSRQRKTWRDHYATVLEKLAEAAIASNEANRAVAYTEQLIDVAPEQDAPVRALLETLVARDNAAAFRRLYDHYHRKHLELDIPPTADITALRDALPNRSAAIDVARDELLRIGAPALRRRKPVKPALAAVIIIGLISIPGTILLKPLPPKAVATAAPKVAVTDFAYSGSAQRAANVLSDALQWRLREVGFDVVDAGKQDSAAIRKLATDDGPVTFVVGGDIAPEGDALVARLWLREAGSGKRVWESRFTQASDNSHLIATELSDAVTARIRRAAGNVVEVATEKERVSSTAWRDLYRARERMEAASDMRRAGSATGSETELKDAEIRLTELSAREPRWALPWVLRAQIAWARASNALIEGHLPQGGAELDRGIRLLDPVTKRLQSADIFEMRGTLKYRRWILGIDDIDAANRVLAQAEADLRQATSLEPERSDSYAALSGVMFAQGKYTEALVYARRAYNSNIFLRNNEEILTRLFSSALHSGEDVMADQWCKELQKVQTGKWPAVLCRIQLAGFAPDLVDINTVERDITNLVAPPQIRSTIEPRLNAAYAVALAQRGQHERARTKLAAVGSGQDPEIAMLSAFAFAALNDAPQTHAMLRHYLSQYRGTRSHVLHMRWLRDAQGSQTHMPLTQ